MKTAILALILSIHLTTPAATLHIEPAEIYDEIPGGYGVIVPSGDIYDVPADGHEIGDSVTVIRLDPGTPDDMTDDEIIWIS